MQFNEYLKLCRERYSLTQEHLVQELYNYNEEFSGLNTSTLSRWERGATRPSLSRQVSIIKVFQKYSTHFFPCFYNRDNVEDELCRVGIRNLIGYSKEHILKLPTKAFTVDDINVRQLSSHEDMEIMLRIPHSILSSLNNNFFNIDLSHLKSWALHPTSLFVVAEYEGQFLGVFFTLRLKPDVFKKIISFEMQLDSVFEDDMADFDEEACSFPVGFFAYNEKIASLLYLRYYAHLIAHQDTITEVGSTPLLDAERRLVEAIHLTHRNDLNIKGETVSAYTAPLEDVLINKDVVKMMFQNQECPEDDY